MTEIIISDGDQVNDGLNYYGSVSDGDDYFADKLNTSVWDDSTAEDKLKGLITATRIIDRLSFKGTKADIDQDLQFPRGTDTDIPQDIHHATYELALKLLDGSDPDTEADNLAISSHSFGAVRTTYDRTYLLAHIQAGIPSISAWNYLKPYLRDPNDLKISRVS